MDYQDYKNKWKLEKNEFIKNFIINYTNNTLYNMQDRISYNEQDFQLILEQLSLNDNKIQVANDIIIKTSMNLPIFSLLFSKKYMYNFNICYQNCINIYKHFLNTNFNESIAIQLTFVMFDLLYKFSSTIMNLLQYKRIFICALKIYKQLSIENQRIVCILDMLMYIYKYYINNQYIFYKKYFINIMAKIFILDILSYYNYNIKNPFLREKKYLLLLDILLSNWNILQKKHKKILKEKSIIWINFLIKKRNSNLEYKNEYCYIISKLE